MKVRRCSTAWLAAAGLVLGAGGGGSALASGNDEERAYRHDALAHAGAVANAYRRLEEHILLQSTAITSWSGSEPPEEFGWRDEWSKRGVRARYCDDTLLVYLAPEELKGVGKDHRSVHVAPFVYVPDGKDERFPALHWLEGNKAEGGAARATVDLPACMTSDPLPSGRAALAGGVKDPFLNIVDGVTRELKREDCPAGNHGLGQRWAREITQRETGRGDAVGAPVEGQWRLIADACRDDYDEWEHFTTACAWNEGAPHYREMEGEEIWRRLKSVTAAGEVYGTPEFVSTSCWGQVEAVEVTPVINETADNQSMSVACGQGFTGSRRYTRVVTTRSTKFPWDAAPVVTVRSTAWLLASSSCVAVPDPPKPPKCDPNIENCDGEQACDPAVEGDCGEGSGESVTPGTHTFDVTETRTRLCSESDASLTGMYVETRTVRYQYELYGDGTRSEAQAISSGAWWMLADDCKPRERPLGTPTGGAPGTPGGGACGLPGDGTASPGDGDCNGMDPGLAAAVAAATGNGNGNGGGGCYFTTAVVEQRGDEPDDGPTLTALRQFRDTYMMETPLRRAMVWAYYRIAPLVVRDLPADDPSWQPMGAHIDRSVELIREGRVEAAFRAYVTGSSRLMLRWWLLRAGKAFS